MSASKNLTLGLSMDKNPYAYGLTDEPIPSVYEKVLDIIFKDRDIHVVTFGYFSNLRHDNMAGNEFFMNKEETSYSKYKIDQSILELGFT